MGIMASLATAYSGLKAAQAGLYVTGHNMANAETVGFVRQRVLQNDFGYKLYGNNGLGGMQLGLGTDTYGIRQIRDIFLDMSYRREASKLGYHDTKAAVGREIEVIIGEMQSDYRMEAILSDMWDAVNELSIYQPGLDVRGNFISTCVTFINKANNVYDRMYDYMHNLDGQIRSTVDEINEKLDKINELNRTIFTSETSGDNANDYRDERNLLMDQLSLLIEVDYIEHNKQIKITSEGKELLANGVVTHLGLKYCTSNYSFVEPVLTESKEIIPASAMEGTYKPFFNLNGSVDPLYGNDNGILKALMVCRGYEPANYISKVGIAPDPKDTAKYPGGKDDPNYMSDLSKYQKTRFNEENAFIPKMMKQFDTIFNSIVKLINDAVSPIKQSSSNPDEYEKDYDNAPYGLDGSQFDEVFTRRYFQRFDGDTYIGEDPDNYYKQYTIGNIILNPVFEEPSGYNKLALSLSGDIEDTRLVFDKLITGWNNNAVVLAGGQTVSVDEAYRIFVNDLAVETSDSAGFAERQASLLEEVDNKRSMISGVSLDEELEHMMSYNHAYNAAARIANTIDGMIDRIINNLGRAGL